MSADPFLTELFGADHGRALAQGLTAGIRPQTERRNTELEEAANILHRTYADRPGVHRVVPDFDANRLVVITDTALAIPSTFRSIPLVQYPPSADVFGILGLSKEERAIRKAKKRARKEVESKSGPAGRLVLEINKSITKLFPGWIPPFSSAGALKAATRRWWIAERALKAASSERRKQKYYDRAIKHYEHMVHLAHKLRDKAAKKRDKGKMEAVERITDALEAYRAFRKATSEESPSLLEAPREGSARQGQSQRG